LTKEWTCGLLKTTCPVDQKENTSLSTSLHYLGFGLQGYQQVHTKYHGGAIHYRVRQEVFSRRGPECGSYHVKQRGRVMRRFRTLPIGDKPVWIELLAQRVFCLLCGASSTMRPRT
jgi:hypothetical protein